MHFINPFKSLRPNEKNVSSVTVPSTDHLFDEVIVNQISNFLLKGVKINTV